ncbi:MAG: phosphomannomutase/phosphoglucomutase, partial [Gemmatimonadetes bacterium]|nr:phosphomannomutase/phosphoglucomutase [Gemmatimonadota bacterium]
MERIDPGIFKAYDIRGTYPDQVDEDVAYRAGRAFVAYTEEPKVLTGRDMRLSGPQLSRAFIDGATDQGADVVDIGLCSTDMLYFSSGVLDLPGVMLTASHNPKEYNGLKMCRRLARPISIDTGLAEIRDMVLSGRFPDGVRKGAVEEVSMLERYVDHVL